MWFDIILFVCLFVCLYACVCVCVCVCALVSLRMCGMIWYDMLRLATTRSSTVEHRQKKSSFLFVFCKQQNKKEYSYKLELVGSV